MPEEPDFLWMSEQRAWSFSSRFSGHLKVAAWSKYSAFFFFLFKDLQSMIEPCYKKLINLTCLGSVLKDLWQWFILSLETYSQTFHINWLVVIFLGFIPQFSKITPFMYWLQSVSFDQRITLPLLIFYSGVWINLFLQVLSWLVSRVRVIQCRH